MLAEPARAEVIVGGAAVLLTLMREFALDELQVSEHDILDGLAASLGAT
jgi:exopolyphosphatase/guanosine-5'-triphosphate,3'-diphosphate pyrophosphatase